MRSHFIPRFQLKYFAIPNSCWNGSEPKVVVIPLEDRPTFVAATANVACQNGMYAVQECGDSQTVEKRLAILEGALAAGLHKIDAACSIHDDERLLIAFFVATQHLRTPAMFEWWEELYHTVGICYQMAKYVIGPVPDAVVCETEKEWRKIAEATQDDIRQFASIQIIKRGKNLAYELCRRSWSFLRSPSGRFVTADEPIRVALPGEPGKISIEDERAIAYWPVTPTTALLIGDSGLREGDYTVDGLEGRLNLWLAERAKFLVTGRPPDDVLREFSPWFGSGPPQFHEIQHQDPHPAAPEIAD